MKLTHQRPILFLIAGLAISVFMAVSPTLPTWQKACLCLSVMASGFLFCTVFLDKLEASVANLLKALAKVTARNIELTAHNLDLQGQVNDLNRKLFLQEKK